MTVAVRVEVESLGQTAELAAVLADELLAGDVLCLSGDLGAGKTAFVAALADRLGVEGRIVSPTFTLENRHRLHPSRPDGPAMLLHCDLYRPGEDARRDLLPSMLEARDEGALLAVEWADPVRDWLSPCLLLSVELVHGEGVPPRRSFGLEALPPDWPAMSRVAAAWRDVARGGSA